MLGRKVEGTKPVSLPHVRAILEQRAGEPDFGYEQQMSLDYARKFAKLTPADADKLAADLAEFEALKPETITKLVDILPAHLSTLQAILAKDRITLSPDKLAKALDKIAHFRTKMVTPPEPSTEPAPVPTDASIAAEDAAKSEAEGKKTKGGEKAAAKEKPVEASSPLDASAAEGKAAKALVKSEKEEKAKAGKSEAKEKSGAGAKKEKGEDKHAK